MGGRFDLVVVGMGSAGMTAATFAADLGVRVGVVERARVGGDCLWTGCVPSKALLASARVAHHLRHADRWGLPVAGQAVDTGPVFERIRAIQREIAATDDNPERFTERGVEILAGSATLTGTDTLQVDGQAVETRFVLLCTGSRPAIPDLPGLIEAGYLTSETVFGLDRAPASLVILGGGPIAVELAQAFTRLGVEVTVLQRGPAILPRDEPRLVERLAGVLRDEGVRLLTDVGEERVEVRDGAKVVVGTAGGSPGEWSADEILVATGRMPNIEGLGLEAAGVEVTAHGITVDDRMQTNVASIYAAGDVAGQYLFTHSAAYEAVRAVRDMFFPGRGRVEGPVPWCTFTDPELAHVGLTAAEALAEHGAESRVWELSLDHSDRARAEGADAGAVMVVTGRHGRIVGGHILAPGAGELIHELLLAVRNNVRMNELGGAIHVYPTIATSLYQLGGQAAYEGASRFRWLARRYARFTPQG